MCLDVGSCTSGVFRGKRGAGSFWPKASCVVKDTMNLISTLGSQTRTNECNREVAYVVFFIDKGKGKVSEIFCTFKSCVFQLFAVNKQTLQSVCNMFQYIRTKFSKLFKTFPHLKLAATYSSFNKTKLSFAFWQIYLLH